MSWRDYVVGNRADLAALQRKVDRLSKQAGAHPKEVWSAPSDERTPELNRKRAGDAWGVRYGQEVDGVRHASEEGLRAASDAVEELTGERPDFAELNALKPGTPEFARRYIQPPEEVETLAPHGPEGIAVVARGETLLETPEPIKIGWSEP